MASSRTGFARRAAVALGMAVGILGAVGAPAAMATTTTDGIAAYYAAHGGAGGPYGAASGPEQPGPAGGQVQAFANGVILWSPPTGTHGLLGPTFAKFTAAGGVTAVGYPTTEINHSGVVDGTYAVFTGGAIFSYVNGGGTITHLLTHTAHHDLAIGGYGSKFGSPLSDEFALGHTGGTEAIGTGGRLYWSPTTGAHLLTGQILYRWAALFGVTGPLGFPTTDEHALAASSGSYVAFQHGDIFSSPRWGAHVVRGAILRAWQGAHHGETVGLGNAVSDARQLSRRSISQQFERGLITYDPVTGVATSYYIPPFM